MAAIARHRTYRLAPVVAKPCRDCGQRPYGGLVWHEPGCEFDTAVYRYLRPSRRAA
jgi:hypothetical protein